MEGSGVNPLGVGIIALALVYLTAAPGVLQGFWDTYVSSPLRSLSGEDMLQEDVIVGRKLAVGGFGTVYMGTSARTIPGLVRKGQARPFACLPMFNEHFGTHFSYRLHSRWHTIHMAPACHFQRAL